MRKIIVMKFGYVFRPLLKPSLRDSSLIVFQASAFEFRFRFWPGQKMRILYNIIRIGVSDFHNNFPINARCFDLHARLVRQNRVNRN